MNNNLKIILVLLLLSIGVTLVLYENSKPVEVNNKTLGIVTKIGCLETTHKDIDLINNKILIEKVIGVPTADLCYLDG